MAITITSSDVISYTGSNLSTTIMDLYVNSVKSKVEDCLNDNYDESLANLIFLNLVAHLSVGSSKGKKTGESAPNGASMSYQVTLSKNGLQSSPYGDQVFMLDTAGCYALLIQPTFMVKTIGC